MTVDGRVAAKLFRRDMVGPSIGNFATSVTGMVLVQKFALEVLVAPSVPHTVRLEAEFGRVALVTVSGLIGSLLGVFGFGFLLSIPSIMNVHHWKIQPNRRLDLAKLWRCLPLVLLNCVVGGLFASGTLLCVLPDRCFAWTEVPDMPRLVCDTVVFLAVQEILFFFLHRMVHVNKRMYQMIHKVHHTWTAPNALSSVYCHPLEHVLCNMFPLLVGPALCRTHMWQISILLQLFMLHTCAVHSGYWICDDNGMHDEHHRYFNCNYGTQGIMDHIFGSYRLPAGAVEKAS
jgi:sterol desaturase/sphingolipid hydroxylase (fatty acid hydroxylase superfamily)